MLTSYNDIKEELLNEWEHLTESRLHEYAESNTPVYYSDIAKEWQELPGEYTDAWKEYGAVYVADTTIYGLMTTDLHLYYFGLVERAFAEITEEKATLELEEA
jgi:hypothetical protein